MKKTIFTTIRGLNHTDGLYGVEIEAEGINLPAAPDGWRAERDGSLQAGFESMEYVTTHVVDLPGVKKQLDTLAAAYRVHKTKVQETQTSGVHVHLNVQDFSLKEFFTLATVYFSLEELLLKFCGPNREGNHFCLRAKDAEFIIHEFVMAAERRKLGGLKPDVIRYCSFNPCSLFKYGSVEFRAMRGTPDLDVIYEWVEIIDTVRKSALEFESPAEVPRIMSMGGPEAFIQRVLKEHSPWFLRISGARDMVKEGIRIVQPLAYATDWNEYTDKIINPFRGE